MSAENVKRFYEDITKDENLRIKLEKLQNEFKISKEASDDELISTIVAMAEKLGYHFSADDFREYFSRIEFSDDDLQVVVGGKINLKRMAVVAMAAAMLAFVVNSSVEFLHDAKKHKKC